MSEPIENPEQLPVAFVIKNASGNISLVFKNDKTLYDFVGQSFYTHPPIKQSSLAEPVAVRYDFDGYGYIYMDAGSGSDWASRVKDCEFLYTRPIRELTDEEILELANQYLQTQDYYGAKVVVGLIDFARELLKKASE
jgi:hypothetical protein